MVVVELLVVVLVVALDSVGGGIIVVDVIFSRSRVIKISLANANILDEFVKVWCTKEALYKIVLRNYPHNSLVISMIPQGFFVAGKAPVAHIETKDNYCGHICNCNICIYKFRLKTF